jgi:signal transduction histidine kinase
MSGTTPSGDDERVQALTRAYRSLAEMNEAIVRATDDAQLFAQTCRVAVEQAGYLGAWIGTVTPEGRVVPVARAGTLDDLVGDPGTTGRAGPVGDPVSTMVQLGHAQYTTQVTPTQLARGAAAIAVLPLRRRGDVIGAMTLYARRSEAFDEQVRGLLEGAAANISYALDVLDRAATLQDVARQRSLLSRRLIDAQEAERARIAADVHDESVQTLAAAVLRLGLLERRVAELAPEAAPVVTPEFDALHQSLDSVTRGLRELLFELETGDLEAPLHDLVEDAAEHIFEHSTVRWAVVVDAEGADDHVRLRPSDGRQALRIVKEAMINARKHARATEVVVTIRPGGTGVELVVRDDGVGFEEMTSPRGHRGLLNMRDRAAVSGGSCRIEGADPGTAVKVWLPYDEDADPPRLAPSH